MGGRRAGAGLLPAAPQGRVSLTARVPPPRYLLGQALHAEWTKFRTVAGPAWLLAGVVTLTVAVGAAAASADPVPVSHVRDRPRHVSFTEAALEKPATSQGARPVSYGWTGPQSWRPQDPRYGQAKPRDLAGTRSCSARHAQNDCYAWPHQVALNGREPTRSNPLCAGARGVMLLSVTGFPSASLVAWRS